MQYKHLPVSVVLACLAIPFIGCGNSTPSEVRIGHWQIDPNCIALQSYKVNKRPDGSLVSMTEATAIGAQLGASSVDFRADRTFTLNVIAPVQGTWTITGNRVLMTPTLPGTKDAPAPTPTPYGVPVTSLTASPTPAPVASPTPEVVVIEGEVSVRSRMFEIPAKEKGGLNLFFLKSK